MFSRSFFMDRAKCLSQSILMMACGHIARSSRLKGLCLILGVAIVKPIRHGCVTKWKNIRANLPCTSCKGKRLKNEALAVKIDMHDISDIARLSIADARQWFVDLSVKLTGQDSEIAARILKEINERLGFLVNVGLGYLAMSRNSGTLSGGESQRIRLASQIGSGLTGVLICS